MIENYSICIILLLLCCNIYSKGYHTMCVVVCLFDCCCSWFGFEMSHGLVCRSKCHFRVPKSIVVLRWKGAFFISPKFCSFIFPSFAIRIAKKIQFNIMNFIPFFSFFGKILLKNLRSIQFESIELAPKLATVKPVTKSEWKNHGRAILCQPNGITCEHSHRHTRTKAHRSNSKKKILYSKIIANKSHVKSRVCVCVCVSENARTFSRFKQRSFSFIYLHLLKKIKREKKSFISLNVFVSFFFILAIFNMVSISIAQSHRF